MSKINKNYTLGLDLGTGSVGYAVINNDYKVVKVNGKHAWGSVLFDNAQTAEKRRMFRSSRRRLARRKERIKLLQSLLGSMIENTDPGFFVRLKDSSLRCGEGEFFRNNRYNLFDGAITDKEFYKQNPTIYHLRHTLMTSDEKADPRMIYLALHHIVKYRGHFLTESQSVDAAGSDLASTLCGFFRTLEENGNDLHYIDKTEKLAEILKDKTMPRSVRREKAVELFEDSGYKKYVKIFAGAVLGYKVGLAESVEPKGDLSKEQIERILDENGKDVAFSFASEDYEEKEADYLAAVQDKDTVFYSLKEVYMAVMYDEILRGKKTISEAMIDRYEKHAVDLKNLKKVFASNMTKEEYKDFFTRNKDVNYVRYIGDKSKGWFKDRVSSEDLCKRIKLLLDKMPDSEEKEYCLREIAKDDFLPLINSVLNAYIPYQFNEKELIGILEKQGRFYPELAENKDKIIALLNFRRPYYVGPLKGDKFGWCEQKIEGKVTPWNFYEKVDTSTLEEKFITRMTSGCSVFPDEEALPRNSILYQAFTVLNELNKIRIADRGGIPVEWKKELFTVLCCAKKKVTKKDIAITLHKLFNEPVKADEIDGMAEDRLTSTMSTLCDFRRMLGDDFNREKIDAYEETVRILSIFEDKKARINRLKSQGVYTEDQIRRLSALHYTGWGSFSKKVICGVCGADGKTVLETLYETDKNFNEIRYDKQLGFAELLNAEEKDIEKFSINDVKDLHCSPVVKQSVWNALRVVEEICDIIGNEPESIYIETTFEERTKKTVSSRVQMLKELYRSIKNDEYFNSECNDKLQALDNRDRLDKDKLYLWFLQLGRCMYSGETIDVDSINDCQIDHIVPRSVMSNDSLNNRVLVKTSANQIKKGRLGMDADIVEKMNRFWQYLYSKKFISSEKLKTLQKTHYDEEDLAGFINRQLTDTSYSVRLVRELLIRRFPNCRVSGIRQSLNHAMRMKYAQKGKGGFYKIRSLNDMHHAKDAYLTAVLGQFRNKGCPSWGSICKTYLSNRENLDFKEGKAVEKARNGIILGLFEKHQNINSDGEVIWDEPFRKNVFNTMASNDCIVVKKIKRMAESAFYDQTLYSPMAGKKNLIPQKYRNGNPLPPDIYGGYSSRKPAYYVIVEHTEKGEKKHSFAEIPVIVNCLGSIDKYIKENFGKDAKVLKYVYKFQLIEYKGQLCYITGVMELNNARQLTVNKKYERLLWLVEQDKIDEIKADTEYYDLLIKEFISYYSGKLRRFYPIVAKFADVLDWITAEKFDSMTIEEKTGLIKKMITLTAPGPGVIRLQTQAGKEEPFGRLSFNIYPDKAIWFDRSITGLRERSHKGV